MKFSERNQIKINSVICGLLILSLGYLLYLIFHSPDKFITDERDFYPNIKVLEQYGFSFAFLRNIRGQSPGPLYQYIYHALSFVLPLTPRNMRLVNFAFVLGDLFLLYLLIRDSAKESSLIALLILGIPMTWLVAGTALTEIPTLFFSLLSLQLLKKAFTAHPTPAFILAIVSGLCTGIAVIGRSPYLVVIPAALILYLIPGKKVQVTLFGVCAIIFPCIVFYAWQGLVPPDVQSIQSGFQFAYFLLSIMYFSITTVILFPGFFKMNKIYYYVSLVVILLSILANIFIFHIKYLPIKGVMKIYDLVPQSMSETANYLFPSLILGVVFIFCVALYQYIRNNNNDIWDFFLLAICMLILLTTIKSSAHFNSKYVIQAYPYFLIFIAKNIKINKFLLFRLVIGIAFGIISLKSYYTIHALLPGN